MKNSKSKRVLALVLSFVMLFGIFTVSAGAASVVGSGKLSTGVTWTLMSDGALEFTGSGKIPDYEWDNSLGRVNSPWHNRAASNSITISSVSFGSGVTAIGKSALRGLDGLTQLTIPGNIGVVGGWSFDSCSNLKTVVIEEGVRTLGDAVFQYCESLETVNIASGVLSSIAASTADGSAFPSCSSLKAVRVISTNPYFCDVDGILFNKSMTHLYEYPAAKTGSSYVIPDTVKGLSAYAFDYAKNLTSIVIPEGLTYIWSGTFYKCTGLQSIEIPEGVTNLEINAFSGCNALSEVKLPSTLRTVGSQVFSGCYRIGNIELPEGLRTIGLNAFSNCGLTSLVIPSTVTSIKSGAFRYNGKTSQAIILSKNCAIDSNAFDTTISLHSWSGSTAETYALTNNLGFSVHNPNVSQGYSVEPDCENPGVEVFGGCSCGVTYEVETDALGHEYSAEKVNPTDGSYPYVLETCSRCGDTKETEIAVTAIEFTQLPRTEYNVGDSMDISGGVITITYEDGDTAQLELTESMIKGFDTSGAGEFIVTVEYGGGSATYNIIVTIPVGTPVVNAYTYGYTSIKMTWDAIDGAEGYEIYRCDRAGEDYFYVAEVGADATEYRDVGLSTGSTYYYKVRAYVTLANGERSYGQFSAYKYARPLPATPVVTANRTSTTTANVSWVKIFGATGYSVYRSDSADGTYTFVANLKSGDSVSYNATGLANGKTYYFKVRAYRQMGEDMMFGSYSKPAKVESGLDVPVITARSVGYTSAKVLWDTVAGADGYEIWRCDVGGGEYSLVTTVGPDAAFYTNAGLSTGTTYYFKVRAYMDTDGGRLYSAMSACATARPIPATPVVKVSSDKASAVTLSWAKIYGATGYSVYRSTEKDGTYTFLAGIADGATSTYTDKTAKAGQTYYYKVRAYRAMGADRMFGNYSNAVSVKVK